ncbi:30S ribosome-binding factor RbfA [Calderihabitans maritimus]|uniref:Ribosome-binding factor A n=1 Tax=Calderihabitans maritimus TaxID=1246530 RepID=A0A1Z5HXQ1_9FIRM|nr:30S ribosome-binding factor RbfA [Calderihabitans maritimus]GAW94302.1 ribosome-binding factor A [Calderihabitans maritimus]
MSLQRAERVAEQIKKEVAQILREEIKDPRIGFVTVTDVEVSSDLRHVKIYVSVYGDKEEQETTMEGLQNATGFIRREIGQRIPLRYTPEIVFKFDRSIEHGARIAELLAQVRKSREENNE